MHTGEAMARALLKIHQPQRLVVDHLRDNGVGANGSRSVSKSTT
jgi:hypothetical protein